uniref:SH3 domain-containing protein n=1 Tax=Caenorhabditis tropicalis TaxID=1561998 RepID=A0A1I7URW1_9PELO
MPLLDMLKKKCGKQEKPRLTSSSAVRSFPRYLESHSEPRMGFYQPAKKSALQMALESSDSIKVSVARPTAAPGAVPGDQGTVAAQPSPKANPLFRGLTDAGPGQNGGLARLPGVGEPSDYEGGRLWEQRDSNGEMFGFPSENGVKTAEELLKK